MGLLGGGKATFGINYGSLTYQMWRSTFYGMLAMIFSPPRRIFVDGRFSLTIAI
jgi:hypothetical protein